MIRDKPKLANIKLKPFEGSLFKPLPEMVREAFLASGVVPINDAYLPYWNNDTDKIMLFYGSYGSGKSVFIIDKLLKKAIQNKYFRCYYGRKILEDVRGSVFKTITDRIKELKLTHLFTFSDAPNGTMDIICKLNKNEFHPFGGNDPESLKSIKDPSDFFCEELNQFDFTDFGLIYSRLRTEKAPTQFYAAFNTEKIYQSHWIRKVFWDGDYADQATKIKVNYYQNVFIDQEDYYNKLKLIANGNAAYLNAIANGEWGIVKTGQEFLKQFDENKHVKPISYQPGVIWLSLDENVNPYVTCTVWQVRNAVLYQIHEILGEAPDNNAPKEAIKVANYLDSIGHRDAVFVCGDPSGRKRSTVDEDSKSFFDKFIEGLRVRKYRVVDKVMKSAPEVALSGAFINQILENMIYGWAIVISDMCFKSIEEYLLTKEDAEGHPFPEKVTDKETKISYELRGHILDSMRYLILTILAKEWNDYKGGYKVSALAGQMGYFG